MKVIIQEISIEDITKIFERVKNNKGYILQNIYAADFTKQISDAFVEEMMKVINEENK